MSWIWKEKRKILKIANFRHFRIMTFWELYTKLVENIPIFFKKSTFLFGPKMTFYHRIPFVYVLKRTWIFFLKKLAQYLPRYSDFIRIYQYSYILYGNLVLLHSTILFKNGFSCLTENPMLGFLIPWFCRSG